MKIEILFLWDYNDVSCKIITSDLFKKQKLIEPNPNLSGSEISETDCSAGESAPVLAHSQHSKASRNESYKWPRSSKMQQVQVALSSQKMGNCRQKPRKSQQRFRCQTSNAKTSTDAEARRMEAAVSWNMYSLELPSKTADSKKIKSFQTYSWHDGLSKSLKWFRHAGKPWLPFRFSSAKSPFWSSQRPRLFRMPSRNCWPCEIEGFPTSSYAFPSLLPSLPISFYSDPSILFLIFLFSNLSIFFLFSFFSI